MKESITFLTKRIENNLTKDVINLTEAIQDSDLELTVGPEKEREITLELVRVTEAAALRASRWMGRGNKERADKAAVDAMRGMLDYVNIDGTVVIGEGEKDKAPMLYIGEKVGNRCSGAVKVDIAVDPLDGTTLTAMGLPNAISVIAIGDKGSLMKVPCFYMEKLAYGPELKGFMDINTSISTNIKIAAAKLGCEIGDIIVIILDRPRHKKIIEDVRKVGARIRLISDGDVAGVLCTAIEDFDAHLYAGIGGSPEAVLSAAGLKCLGGEIQTKFWIQNEEEKRKVMEAGYTDLEEVFFTEDLAKGTGIIFSATGVTGGYLLSGVKYTKNKAITHSIVMRARTSTVRYVKAIHNLEKKTVPSRDKNKEVGIRDTGDIS
ncbi:MAG TPA: class II fructose-bisphosphatase [Candidatus Eremiobacteraeota bacterium]|nr:MAG: Fructose-1,6-bisphosphatase class 2 [bacterium ADurb.Bin363]HPZ06506.1 class II fructose-bisphosphatase [Candidatus Eremiobacteraeota bacterium]